MTKQRCIGTSDTCSSTVSCPSDKLAGLRPSSVVLCTLIHKLYRAQNLQSSHECRSQSEPSNERHTTITMTSAPHDKPDCGDRILIPHTSLRNKHGDMARTSISATKPRGFIINLQEGRVPADMLVDLHVVLIRADGIAGFLRMLTRCFGIARVMTLDCTLAHSQKTAALRSSKYPASSELSLWLTQ